MSNNTSSKRIKGVGRKIAAAQRIADDPAAPEGERAAAQEAVARLEKRKASSPKRQSRVYRDPSEPSVMAATVDHLRENPSHEATCPQCKRTFDRKVSRTTGKHGAGQPRKYCSDSCQEKAEDDRRYAREGRFRPRDPATGKRDNLPISAEGTYVNPDEAYRTKAEQTLELARAITTAKISGEYAEAYVDHIVLAALVDVYPESLVGIVERIDASRLGELLTYITSTDQSRDFLIDRITRVVRAELALQPLLPESPRAKELHAEIERMRATSAA